MYRILFADDDTNIRNAVHDYFTANGFEVTLAADGEDAAERADETEFDLIILDVMMPVLDGLGACRRIRKAHTTPVLFLSALGEEKDCLSGFSAGADDWITKPFPLSVLLEKCLAIIRRSNGANGSDVITAGGVLLDMRRKIAFADGKEIPLSAKDFEMLEYLMSKKGTVLSRNLILSRVWGYELDVDDRVVDTHIKNIRKALGKYASFIRTYPGRGYCFEKDGEKE